MNPKNAGVMLDIQNAPTVGNVFRKLTWGLKILGGGEDVSMAESERKNIFFIFYIYFFN